MSNEEKSLREEIKNLKEENARLRREKEQIEKEFEDYKTLHVLTVNELRKALNVKGNNHKKSKKLGAPKGHKGYSRHIPERIDYVEKLDPVKCPTCDSELSDTQEIRQRYMTDLEFRSEERRVGKE